MFNKLRSITFVLPQFNPILENDSWWRKGFFEWTNVSKTKPLIKGHYQSRILTDLEYYDLRLPTVREAKADISKVYGIHWFSMMCLVNYLLETREYLSAIL